MHNLHYEKFQDGTVKCIEDEIPFEVPDGWEWTRIFSISNELPYGTAKKSEPSGKVIVLRMGNIQNGEVDYSDLVYSSDDSDIEKYNLTPGDLLFNRTNSSEWVGKTSIYRGDFPAIYAGYIIRLRTPLNPEYLNSVMNSSYAYQYCRMVKTDGVNQSNINAQKLGAFLVPVAPKAEQIMIANKISDILPQIDSITECKTSLEETVSYVKSKVLDLAIRGKLVAQNPDDESASVLLERIRTEKEDLIKQGKLKRDKKDSIIYKGDDNSYYEKFNDGTVKCVDESIPFDLPETWQWCRLQELLIVSSSKRVLQADWKKEGIPFYRAREIVKLSEQGDVDNELFITQEHYNSLKEEYGVPEHGDIMLSAVGTIGKAYIVKDNDVFYYKDASVICLHKVSDEIDSDFIKLVIESPYMQKLMHDNSNGTTVDTITISTANQYLFPLPPLNEQNEIIKNVHRMRKCIDSIEANLI